MHRLYEGTVLKGTSIPAKRQELKGSLLNILCILVLLLFLLSAMTMLDLSMKCTP